MPSPFPGMDPYLEMYWGDVHARLCPYICDALQPQLGPSLVARTQERLLIETEQPRGRPITPDVEVEGKRTARPIRRRDSGGVGLAEPLVIRYLKTESTTEGFVNILDPRSGDALVTVVEVLSPTNKRAGPDHRQYRRKQRDLEGTGVSLVEIDLLRTGRWTVQTVEGLVPDSHREPYRVSVHRSWGEEMAYEFYYLPLRERLPKVRVPLREGDADAVLDLQALVRKIYDNGAYGRTLRYDRQADPPLRGGDAAWAADLLVKAGKRKPARKVAEDGPPNAKSPSKL